MLILRHAIAGKRCAPALVHCAFVLALVLGGGMACAATLAEKARESGCANKPSRIDGSTYRCTTESGANSYFNVPGEAAEPRAMDPGVRTKATSAPTPSGFPRVDPSTQRSRDDLRRKVLGDELSSEEKLLAEARAAYANGAPSPLPEEQANAERYRERIGRLRQSVQLHERNIDALKKELGSGK